MKNCTPAVDRRALVSVVIPCYEQAHFLRGALTSVIAQASGDIEIVVVDDGSPDDVTAVVREFEGGLRADVVCLRQDNMGLPAARNAGVRRASGDLILPLDADDRLAPGAIQVLVSALVDGSSDVAYGDRIEFGARTGLIRSMEFDLDRLCWNNFVPVSSMFTRRAWATVNGYDESMRDGYEDWDFWLSCAEAGLKFAYVAAPTLCYRVRPGSMVTRAARQRRALIDRLGQNHRQTFTSGRRRAGLLKTAPHALRERMRSRLPQSALGDCGPDELANAVDGT